jgi:flagellar protein FlaI
MLVKTKVDELVGIVSELKSVQVEEASATLGIPSSSVEKIGKTLERAGLMQVVFPLNLMQKPILQEVQVLSGEKEKKSARQERSFSGVPLEKYLISGENGHVSAQVSVYRDASENRPFYKVDYPTVSEATDAYLRELKDEVASELPLYAIEGTDEERKAHFDKRCNFVESRLAADLSGESKEATRALCGILLHSMYGLGDLEVLMADDWLEEVIVNNSHTPVGVYHRKYGWMKTSLSVKGEEETLNLASQIGRHVGRQISLLNPLLDAYLPTGDRVNAMLYPVSSLGNNLTIRKFARNPWTIVHFIDKQSQTMSSEMAAMLWQAVQYEMNVLVAGGTASGKTSALNALASFIPPHQRVMSIEDTREINLPSYQWNWIPSVTRTPNPEGLGEVSMLDLMVSSLRMRPDRILVGEIRRRKEAEVLFEAMHTGHSVYSTMHADTGAQLVRRLIEPPIEIPESEVQAVHLILVQYRDRRKNIRKTLEISEATPGMAGSVEVSKIFSWRPRSNSFEKAREPRRYVEELNLHTGMTAQEAQKDVEEKQEILEWMLKRNMKSIDEVGAVMRAYYADPKVIVDAAKKNKPLPKLE